MRSTEELVNALRSAPSQWTDAAIVVAFDNRFEFVKEDTPDATGRLKLLEERGGLAIGLAGVENANAGRVFMAKVFPEYEGQRWAHRSMDRLRNMVHRQSHKNSEKLPIDPIGPEEF
jgi:hypothetical protein